MKNIYLKEENNSIIDPDDMAAITIGYFSKILCFAGTSQEASIIDDVIQHWWIQILIKF